MIEKEFRALLPMWLAVVAAMLGAHQLGRGYEFLAVPAFIIGAAALGSLSFGQEYMYRTVGLVLTLPVPRSRIWGAKVAVLGVLVASLALLATVTAPFGRVTGGVVPLTALAAIGLAPWLAMLSRSVIGGAVFAASLPGVLFVASQFIGLWMYGYARQADHFTVTFMTVATVSLSALGLFLGWRTFAGLEAIEGRGAEVALLPFSGGASAVLRRRRSHPVWLLVRKELRLQQMTWVLAAIYVALYVAIVQFSQDRGTVDNSATLITVLYTVVVSILIGALAGGEEHQLGVHDTQLLLPMSSRRQWIVKVATSLGLGVVLTIVLPLILVTVLPPEAVHILGRRGVFPTSSTMLMPTLVTLGLYVSVVAGSGVRGLIVSIPVGMTMFYVFMQFIMPRIFWLSRTWQRPTLPRNAEPYALALVLGLFLVLVLRLALSNYRWNDRSPLRLAVHTAIAFVTLIAGFTLLAALGIR